MKLENLQKLMLDQLKDTYDAEHQITKALPKMQEAASSPELQRAFQTHLNQTQSQISRLEQVFEMLGQKPSRKACKGMQGLIEEGNEMMKENADSDVRDAGLIASAQKVEHYEISAYGTLRTYANLLGHHQAADLLQQTLDEEAQTDEMLTQIASKVNVQAAR